MSTKNSTIVGWKIARIDDCFDIQQGKQVSKSNRKGQSQRSFLRTANVFWGKFELSNLDHMNFTPEEEKRLALLKGDLLVCEGGDIGRTAIWNNELEVCYYQNHLHRLRKKDDKVDENFIFFYLKYAFVYARLYSGRANITTIPNLSKSRLGELEIKLPSLIEQKEIAKVLTTVQEAIAGQEEVIAKLKELKRSMMQHLFSHGTKGEKTKKTEIGEIPVSWEVLNFEDCLQKIRTGKLKPIPLKEYCNLGKYPIVDQGKSFIAGYTDKPEKVIFDNLPLIVFGDHTRILKFIDFPFSLGADGTKLIKPNGELFENKFFFYQVTNLDVPNRGYNRHYSILKENKIVKPSMEEQKQISSVLVAIDNEIELVQEKLLSYQNLFKTLLHELMSGERRVKV